MVNNLLLLVSCLLSSYSASDNLIRLSGSNKPCSGRIEIYHNGSWGTVCDDGWDLNDAAVACRQLDCGPALGAPQSAYFGQGTGQIWLDDLVCSGNESSLAVCGHREFGTHDCGHHEDAGVICSNHSIRLSGSNEPCSGRVEIYHNGSWGTVCDDGWDLNDAAVACRQLDCGPALGAPPSAYFGQGTGQIWLDDLACSGSETYLGACGHNGFGTQNCVHGEDAGVICSMVLPKPNVTLDPPSVIIGQTVNIVCSVSEGQVGTFIFKKTSGPIIHVVNSSSSSASFHINQVSLVDHGLYQCQFQRRIFNQDLSSNLSDSVQLTVMFPKPIITIQPTGVVTSGQDVHISCSIPGGGGVNSMIFTKTPGPRNGFVDFYGNQATLHIHNVISADEGSYQCQVQSGASSSVLSDFVHLNLTEIPPKPNITMDPAGVVTFGDLITINCSISTQYLDGSFTLQKTSGSFTKTQQSSTNSSTFRFLEANDNHVGDYYCYYQKTVDHQTLTSPNSDSVTVSVSDN